MMKGRIFLITLAVLCSTYAFADGKLYVGSDHAQFNSLPGGYVIAITVGANVNSFTGIGTTAQVNGLGDPLTGILYAGEPDNNNFYHLNPSNGAVLTSGTGGMPNFCCNEDYAFNGTALYHVHWDSTFSEVMQLDPNTGAVLASNTLSFGAVGITFVGGSHLWITDWAGQTVGRYDFATNTYTPVFSTPNLAGGLAFDDISKVLWVGQGGGAVLPYDLAGDSLGAGFFPIGPIADTIDGLGFVPTPEPGSIALLGSGLLGVAGILRRKLML
jgi:hypothetical protein